MKVSFLSDESLCGAIHDETASLHLQRFALLDGQAHALEKAVTMLRPVHLSHTDRCPAYNKVMSRNESAYEIDYILDEH